MYKTYLVRLSFWYKTQVRHVWRSQGHRFDNLSKKILVVNNEFTHSVAVCTYYRLWMNEFTLLCTSDNWQGTYVPKHKEF